MGKNATDYKVVMIETSKIRPSPYQPRKYFDKLVLEELSDSIKQFGIMQPLNVRFINKDHYELIAGERRLRAAKMAMLKEVPAIILDVNDKDSAILSLVENLQRQNLSFFEEAEGYANLIVDYELTQEDVAKQVGKSQSTIANKIRLLKLPQSVVKVLQENNLSERHARAMLKLPTEELQLAVLNKVVAQSLNVKKTEELIENTLSKIMNDDDSKKKKSVFMKRYLKDIRIFTNTIKQAVDMVKSGGVDVEYNIKEEKDLYNITIKIPMKADE